MLEKPKNIIISKIVDQGISSSNQAGVNQNIRICNQMAVTICFILIPYIFLQIKMGRLVLSSISFFFLLFYISIPFLNHLGYTESSRILMAVSGHTAILAYSILYGKESGVYQIFILACFFPIIYFDKTEKSKQLISFFLSIISVIIFQLFFHFINIIPIRLTEYEYTQMSNMTFYSTLILVYSAMAYYYFQEKKTVETLSNNLDELQFTVGHQKKELEDSRELYKNLYEKTNDAVFLIDISTGKYLDANKSGERITGRSVNELKSLTIYDVTPEGAFKRTELYKSYDHPADMGEIIYVRPDGSKRIGSLSVVPMGNNVIFGLVRDITEQKRAEKIKIQSEKMLSVGVLAAGMAHELNNPLAGMLQNANVMQNRLIKKSDHPRNIEAAERAGTSMTSIKQFILDREIDRMMKLIIESGEKMSIIVSNMLSFINRSDKDKAFYDPKEIIESTLLLASRDFAMKLDYKFKDFTINKSIDDKLPPVYCEISTIQQVLLNIFRNGAHAMHSLNLDKPQFAIRCFLNESESMVSFEIENNGPPINRDIINRILDPFFTTKDAGQGTGLGLAVSYFIITEDHKGQMVVDSTMENGAKVTILLPIQNKLRESNP